MAGIVRNPTRNARIVQTLQEMTAKGLSTLVIVDYIEHGDELLRLSQELGLNARYVQGSSTDRHDLVRGFANARFPILISTTILDEGIDISGIGALIIATGKKSRRQLLQRIGRSLRKKKVGENVVYIFDFMDMGNRYLEKHSKLRKKLYAVEGFDVTIVPKIY
jgi:superfamily II DNA or RNA helicase